MPMKPLSALASRRTSFGANHRPDSQVAYLARAVLASKLKGSTAPGRRCVTARDSSTIGVPQNGQREAWIDGSSWNSAAQRWHDTTWMVSCGAACPASARPVA